MKNLAWLFARAVPWGVVALQAWLGHRLIMQHGRCLLEQDRLGDRLDRVEWLVADLASREIGLPSAARVTPPTGTDPSQTSPPAESSAER